MKKIEIPTKFGNEIIISIETGEKKVKLVLPPIELYESRTIAIGKLKKGYGDIDLIIDDEFEIDKKQL